MKKFCILVLLLSGIVLADNAASGTSSAQRWPWNGKVDINYTLTATTTNTTPVFSVKFFGEDPEGNKFELTSLSGDGATEIILGAGPKKAVWDAQADLGSGIDTNYYKVGVYAKEVTEEADYLVLDLTTYKMRTSTVGPDVSSNAPSKYAELWLRRIEPGTFIMGSATTEPGRNSSTEAEHLVTLTKAYYIGVFELTSGQYTKIYNNITSSSCTPSSTDYASLRGTRYGATWPAKNDYRVDATSFFGKLRQNTGNGLIFDLPTEAQWEAASRWKGTTGNGTNDYHGSSCWNNGVQFDRSYTGYDDVGWCSRNAGSRAHEVGLKAASTSGTYDMHGNAWEVCLDWNTDDITSYVIDPEGPETGSRRNLRGSYWGNDAPSLRMAARNSVGASYYGIGFRVALLP